MTACPYGSRTRFIPRRPAARRGRPSKFLWLNVKPRAVCPHPSSPVWVSVQHVRRNELQSNETMTEPSNLLFGLTEKTGASFTTQRSRTRGHGFGQDGRCGAFRLRDAQRGGPRWSWRGLLPSPFQSQAPGGDPADQTA